MAKVKLVNISDGWDYATIPDNITVRIETRDASFSVPCSLEELVIIYSLLVNNAEASLMIGTGAEVLVKSDGTLVVGGYNIPSDSEGVEDDIIHIIKEAINIKDSIDPENRGREIRSIDRYIERRFGHTSPSLKEIYSGTVP